MLLLYAVLIGTGIGLAAGGRLSALGSVHIRLWPLALAGLAFQALLFSSPLAASVGELGPPLYVISTAVVLLALMANLRQPGFWLIALGALLNFSTIVVNGGQMPASPEAVAALSGAPLLPTSDFSNSVIATNGTQLLWLGDIFVLPRPIPLANIFSIGDALIGLGGAVFILRTMTCDPRSAEQQPATTRPRGHAFALGKSVRADHG
jgi:hypothetical protein